MHRAPGRWSDEETEAAQYGRGGNRGNQRTTLSGLWRVFNQRSDPFRRRHVEPAKNLEDVGALGDIEELEGLVATDFQAPAERGVAQLCHFEACTQL